MRKGAGVHDLGPGRPCGEIACPVRHPPVRDGRAILDDEGALSAKFFSTIHPGRHRALNDEGSGVFCLRRGAQGGEGLRRGGVGLGDEKDIGHAQVRLARMVDVLMSRAVGVEKGDVQISDVEGKVVVPAVPEDDIPLPGGFLENRGVVHPGEDASALRDVGEVLLPLLDGAAGGVEIFRACEALHPLPGEVAVGHGVADDDRMEPHLPQEAGDGAADRAFAAAGADGRHGDHGKGAGQLGPPRAQQVKIGAGRERPAGQVHHLLVGDVAVGEDDLLHPTLANDLFEFLFGEDGNAAGVAGAGQRRGVVPAADAGNLGRRESNDPVPFVIAIAYVEVVKVPAGRAQDQRADGLAHRVTLALGQDKSLGRAQCQRVPSV